MSPIDLLEHMDKSSAPDATERINGADNENANGTNQEENSSDDTEINSVNQDTTPTPTPNESNSKTEVKFTEFSQPKNLPPPNSLPLRNNLNSACNKNALHHSYTSQSIYNISPMSYPGMVYSSLPNTPQMPVYPQQLMNFSNRNDAKASNQSSTVYVHVDAGHIFQVQLGDKVRDIIGPATVKIVNNDNTQPVPLQLTSPAPGQIVQQIVDENGMLVHLIISSPQPNQLAPMNGSNRTDSSNNCQQVYNKTNFNNFNGLNAPKNYSYNRNSMVSHHSKVPRPATHFKNPFHSKINCLNSLHSLQAYRPNNYPNHQFGYYNQYQYSPGAPLNPISVESVQENKENSLSDLDSEASLICQAKSDAELNESSTNSATPGLSSNSVLSISPLSSSSCSSTSASNSSSSHCSISNTFKTDDLNSKNQQNLRLNQSMSQQAITTDRSKENKPFANSNSKPTPNGTINSAFTNPNNKLPQAMMNFNGHVMHQQFYPGKYQFRQMPRQPVNQPLCPKNQASSGQSLLIENHRLHQEPIDLDAHIESNLAFFESILRRIKEPIVKNIQPQSVFVYLSAIELTKEDLLVTDSSCRPILVQEAVDKLQNLNYTLEISCETENNFDKVYSGEANEITLKDLMANTQYYLRVSASLNQKCKSPTTETVSFRTKTLQPDQPLAPKQVGVKKKNELTIKWLEPNSNGSKIQTFLLEYQEISNQSENLDEIESNLGEFSQIYKGTSKQYIVKKLKANTCYAFRVAAENSHGLSEFSPVSFITTSGGVPSTPDAPKLIDSTVSSLDLVWGPKRLNDMDYELQMLDQEDKIAAGHGFLTVYHGSALTSTVKDLRRKCVYQFRLRAKNEEGSSAWSDIAKFTTKADVPKQPGKIRTKIQANSVYKFSWDSPKDDGGDKILRYALEMSENETEGFEEIYYDEKDECEVQKHLKPGQCYYLRVCCSNSIGQSHFSEISKFWTPSIAPGKCNAPKLNNKPKPNSAQIKWTVPDSNGGADVTNYELSIKNNSSEEENVIYRGNELTYTVDGLNPGHNYNIRLRAINKNGHGPWSDNLHFTSGATCPNAPDSLVISTKSSNCLLINWSEPESNGSPIIEYKLEWTAKENGQFTNLYTGNSLKHELRNLFLPNTKYLFRIQAISIIGPSQYSQIVEYISPASVPGIVTGIRLEEIHTDSALVSWKPPNTNGSPIQFYNIDFNEQSAHSNPYVVLHQNECTYLFDSLQPDTNYKFRIQAANSVGIGQFSNLVKFKTKALAPQPPSLECVWVSYNGIKLKWNSGENFTYILQYRKNDSKNDDDDDIDINCGRFATAYEGSSNQFRLNKLSESSSYLFRICAINEAGQGKWSHNYNFSTAKSPPIITKAPAVSQISSNGCLVEWNKSNQERSDFLEYCLQIQKKDGDFKEAYRGSDCCHRFKDLETNSEYSVRVCAAIRKDETTLQRICAPFSPIGTFTTSKSSKAKEKANGVERKQSESSNQTRWVDRILFPAFFTKLNAPSKKNSISKNLSSNSKASKKSSLSKPIPSELDSDSISTIQSTNDHCWAFLLIIFLVILAFLIAYCVSFYFDVATVRSVEF